MTPPQVIGPEVIKDDSWAARNPILPTFETDSASDPIAFGPVRRNRPSDQPDLLLGPQSWDSFYVDRNGLMQDAGKEKWDGFYMGREWFDSEHLDGEMGRLLR